MRGLRTHQDSFGQDGDNKAASKDTQVLCEELGGHDEPRGADEQAEEELLERLQLVQRALLLLSCAHHHARHKCAQLR